MSTESRMPCNTLYGKWRSLTVYTGQMNLRVRSIRGMEFLTRTAKKVCGSQNQRFMYVDGDKAVSGSYSFTWTSSRIDRNIITVLSGQVVDAFDKLFQDLYVMSNAVNLHKLNLDTEPKPEPPPQTAPVLFPSANLALKLINPKYALVSSSATANSNCMPSGKDTAKTENCKQTKGGPEVPLIHPGLLHLEKVNMIHYLPLWPMPDPPKDVIGFINLRQYKKTETHLVHSEVSHAIRFKETFHSQTLPDRACARSTPEFLSPASVLVNDPHHQTIPVEKTTHGEPLEQMQPHSHNEGSQQEAQNDVKDKMESPEAHDMEKHMDASAEQIEEIHALSRSTGEDIPACLSSEQHTAKISENRPSYPETSPFSVECEPPSPSPKVTRASFTEATSGSQSCNKDTESFTSKTADGDNQRVKDYSKTPNHNSSSSSTSEEYFECSDSFPVDSGFEGTAKGTQLSIGLSEQNQGLDESNLTPTHCMSSLTLQLQQGPDGTITACSRHEILKETEEIQPHSGSQEQGTCQATTGMRVHKSSELEATREVPANRTNEPSDPAGKANEQQPPEADAGADPSAEPGSESREHGVSWKAKTVTRVASDKAERQDVKVEKLPPEPYSVVNNMVCFQSKETRESDESHAPENKTHEVMHDKQPAPVEQAEPGSQTQSIVPDVGTEVKPELHSASHTSDHRSAAEHHVKHHRVREEDDVLHMPFQSDPGDKRLHEEDDKPPSNPWLTDDEEQMIIKYSDLQQAGYVSNPGSELKENTVKESCKVELPAQKPQAEMKGSANTCSSIKKQPSSPGVFGKEEPVLEHISHEFKNQPEAKPEIKQNMKKSRQASKKARVGSFKAPDTKLQVSSVPTKPAAHMLGGHKLPHRGQLVQSRAGERSPSDAAPTQPCQAHLGHPQARTPQKQRGRRRRAVQLGQHKPGPRSTLAAEDSPSSPSTSFPKTIRSLKDKMTGSSQISFSNVTESIKGDEQE
ncbi:uncharacterized protein fam83ga isoform X2 [Brachyhypopomus gauderio]|uniref:uncharacterized protein fam83ga isoform X2 n=1 Tax=Brachyhypopomus gauderio TaxID=698409 RepID=UPI00404183D7